MSMRRSLVLAAALTTAALAPAAAAVQGGGPDGEGPPGQNRGDHPAPDRSGPTAPTGGPERASGGAGAEDDVPRAESPRPKPPVGDEDEPHVERVRYVLRGVVVRDARRRGVPVEIVKVNEHLREALDRARRRTQEDDPVTRLGVRIDTRTAILVRRAPRGGNPGRGADERRGESTLHKASHRVLRKGDTVTVVWLAPPDAEPGDLPAARKITALGRSPFGGAGRGRSGAAFTTNRDGTAVNVNRYASADDVYLNGGPGCGAQRHAAALPDGAYYFRVTNANGRTLLSTSPREQRMFVMKDSAVISSTAPWNPLGCDEHGLVVSVAPFDASPNGVYKLWIAPKASVEDGVFPLKQSKTDNFRIDPSLGHGNPDPDPDPDPNPEPSL